MNENVIIPLAQRGNGDIYLGVVGAVRTGKSTFIKKFIENLVVPNIDDEIEKKRYLDEIPQSASGKTIMTTEPKFVPSNGAKIKVDEFSANVKLIDCVGYIIPNANGYEDENGNPRMVMTPWFSEPIPFVEAAEVGTEKVIRDHSTISIVVTTDGSIGELKRADYIEAEAKVVNELKSIGKPFIVILNTKNPRSDETLKLTNELIKQYDVPVIPLSVLDMRSEDINEVLKTALYEYPVLDIKFSIPEWVHILDNKNDIKKHYLELIKNCVLRLFVSIFIDTSQSPHNTPYFSSKGIKPFILLSFRIRTQSSSIVYSLLSFRYGFETMHLVYSLYSFSSPPKPPVRTMNLSFSLVKIQ